MPHDRDSLLGSVYCLHAVFIRDEGVGPIGHLKRFFGPSKYSLVEGFLLVELLLRPQLLVQVLVVHVRLSVPFLFISKPIIIKTINNFK